ncbi:transposase [Spiroplasma endosymbiont of Glossina fuscipes fuscipes]|uniref:transposase n=1 Tax=Spiroplasma endosymbiont of Glossina fuscipes fuscipes TaxID=2004463 RepID=UPI003C789791
MNLKDLLNEMFDNYPDCYRDYGLAIMDRYEIEVEKKKLTPEENELIELRKRNKQLEMENDILKQAALIIGKK